MAEKGEIILYNRRGKTHIYGSLILLIILTVYSSGIFSPYFGRPPFYIRVLLSIIIIIFFSPIIYAYYKHHLNDPIAVVITNEYLLFKFNNDTEQEEREFSWEDIKEIQNSRWSGWRIILINNKKIPYSLVDDIRNQIDDIYIRMKPQNTMNSMK
jgi:hypothetical protein